MVRRFAEVHRIGRADAQIGVFCERLQPPRPAERQNGVQPPQKLVFRLDGDDFERIDINRDADGARRAGDVGFPVECERDAVGFLQFGDECQRQVFASAVRGGEMSEVDDRFLHVFGPFLPRASASGK